MIERMKRTQRGAMLMEALFWLGVSAIVVPAALILWVESENSHRLTLEDVQAPGLARAIEETLAMGTWPPCGATSTTPVTCTIPTGTIPTSMATAGWTATAVAQTAQPNPSGQTSTVTAGDFVRITVTLTGPSTRARALDTWVAKP